MNISQHTRDQLEFDKILDFVISYTKGRGARERILNSTEIQSREELRESLLTVKDVTMMILENELFDLYSYDDISEDLFLLGKKGYVLEIESVHRILSVFQNYDAFIGHFDKKRKKGYPHIYELGFIEDYSDQPIKKILAVFDDEGQVRPDASPELVKIHKKITGTSREADKRFNELLLKYKKSNLLGDTEETLRNGRRVLVLPVENKRKNPGRYS